MGRYVCVCTRVHSSVSGGVGCCRGGFGVPGSSFCSSELSGMSPVIFELKRESISTRTRTF